MAERTEQRKPHLPIGYWVKKVDELLTARINEVQRENGLTRTEWQVLNALYETSSSNKREIVELLQPFAGVEGVEAAVDSLIQRGFVEAADGGSGTLQLTEAGRDLHAKALKVQQTVRMKAVEGISESDYVTTVRVLQQMVENLSDPETRS